MSQTAINDLLSHPQLITSLASSKVSRLIWISEGGLEAAAFPSVEVQLKATLAFFGQHGSKYTYVGGPSIGAVCGHVWDTRRKRPARLRAATVPRFRRAQAPPPRLRRASARPPLRRTPAPPIGDNCEITFRAAARQTRDSHG